MDYEYLWRNKFLCVNAKDFDEFIDCLEDAVDTLKRWRDKGVTLSASGGVQDDYAQFLTDDPEFAKREHFTLVEDYEEEEDGG